MSVVDPAQRALYARLEEVLGADPATTLMTRLPTEPASRLAAKTDIDTLAERIDARFEGIDVRFEAIEQRFDRMDQRMDQRFERLDDRLHDLQDVIRDQMRFFSATTVWAMTGLTGMFAVVVALIT